MTIDSTGTSGIRRLDDTSGEERAALEGMLKGYPVEQLVEEVLIAWQELAARNEEMVSVKQRLRVLELDLAEREDMVAPEVARLNQVEASLQEGEAKIIHLERLLGDARAELASQQSSISQEERDAMSSENSQLRDLSIQQDEVIAELEGRIGQMVEALERAAEAGLTSVTAEEVRSLKSKLDAALMQNEAEQSANKALEEERQRLRDIADRLRGLLDARDGRLGELEEQLERVMQGPRSVSAEPDYLVEQIEELKRRLLERNREYESLRRRERRLHNDVFERDERVQQITLTLTDMEAALQDRTAELRELEGQRESMSHELDSVRRGERTREVVGRVFADSLSLVRTHDAREAKREAYSNEPDKTRTLSTPNTSDMAGLAEGGKVSLSVEETDITPGMDVDGVRPPSPGGTGDPVLFEDED
jgi:DNA repair exonuclease SbcCD ATPase subunit